MTTLELSKTEALLSKFDFGKAMDNESIETTYKELFRRIASTQPFTLQDFCLNQETQSLDFIYDAITLDQTPDKATWETFLIPEINRLLSFMEKGDRRYEALMGILYNGENSYKLDSVAKIFLETLKTISPEQEEKYDTIFNHCVDIYAQCTPAVRQTLFEELLEIIGALKGEQKDSCKLYLQIPAFHQRKPLSFGFFEKIRLRKHLLKKERAEKIFQNWV